MVVYYIIVCINLFYGDIASRYFKYSSMHYAFLCRYGLIKLQKRENKPATVKKASIFDSDDSDEVSRVNNVGFKLYKFINNDVVVII